MTGEYEGKTSLGWKAWTVIGGVIMALPVFLGLLEYHTSWHDEKYYRKIEVYTKEEADRRFAFSRDVLLVTDADQIKKTVESNVQKLDYIVKAQARAEIRDLERQLVDHEDHRPDPVTLAWSQELLRIKSELRDANNYYECVRLNRDNCENER